MVKIGQLSLAQFRPLVYFLAIFVLIDLQSVVSSRLVTADSHLLACSELKIL